MSNIAVRAAPGFGHIQMVFPEKPDYMAMADNDIAALSHIREMVRMEGGDLYLMGVRCGSVHRDSRFSVGGYYIGYPFSPINLFDLSLAPELDRAVLGGAHLRVWVLAQEAGYLVMYHPWGTSTYFASWLEPIDQVWEEVAFGRKFLFDYLNQES